MSDFDPDAYLAEDHTQSSQGFDPDAYLAESGGGTSGAPVPMGTHAGRALDIATKHPFTVGAGLLENTASSVTGGFGSLADALTGSDPGTHDYAYRPRTEAGKELASLGAEESQKISHLYDRAFGVGPLAQTVKERLPEAAGAIGTVAGLAEPFRPGAPREAPMAGNPQSISAAAATPQFGKASPELQAAFNEASAAQRAGTGSANMEAVNRHLEAESLPVPIRLTKGQAGQNPAQISLEMNNRSRLPGVTERLNEQNQGLVDNLQAVRDQVGERVFSSSPAEHGDTLIKAYQDKDAAVKADIKAKYQALTDANGGKFPVDGKTLVDNADAALAKQYKARFLPSEVRGMLDDFRGGMDFEGFENLRTTLAAATRKAARSGDGNAEAALNIVREQAEQLPMQGGSANLKGLANQARSAAKARFDALREDPAYKAAVDESVDPDKFVGRFVTGAGASRDSVALMRKNLAGNDSALSTMSVAALDYLRDGARVGAKGGNFSQYGYNKALQSLQDKSPSLFDPRTRETLDTLGNVANYTQFQPRGSFVNNSNTTVAARAKEFGKTVAEQAINAKFGGLPVGSWVRGKLDARAAKQAADEILKPGAGILEPAPPR
jgi:hypothetical protein